MRFLRPIQPGEYPPIGSTVQTEFGQLGFIREYKGDTVVVFLPYRHSTMLLSIETLMLFG